jgi:hypothetical protein
MSHAAILAGVIEPNRAIPAGVQPYPSLDKMLTAHIILSALYPYPDSILN